ncbi:ATP-grasp domain-containing protein, partial [Bacillus mycoides]|uniref:ATP-grasp domain-containing protein n=1 Tax=Bacillus mycoides TaxID=1405 RepID=UPI003A7FB03E
AELVNHDFVCGELQELTPIADEFFIRPTGNTKLFTGKVVTKEEFLEWQVRENYENSPYKGQRLMISPVRELLAEYRFFVVNQRVITGSSYQVNGKSDVTKPITESLLNYVNGRVFEFWVADSYVIDVAETPDGFKVVEYNNTNTSGLYGCDAVAIVTAINKIQEG